MKVQYNNAVDLEGKPLQFCIDDGVYTSCDETAHVIDLAGATVHPGIVDAHCHIIPMGLDMLKLHLGSCDSRADVLDKLRDWAKDRSGGWIHAVHYDQTKFSDSKHLSRQEIDSVVSDAPVVLRHSNGHASVANTEALRLAGVNDDTSDPPGGTFVRDGSGQLTGVLLERAHERVTSSAPAPGFEDMVEAVLRAGEKMSDLGVTCASDMMTGRWNLELELRAYAEASRRGCRVRIRLYAQWGSLFGAKGIKPELLTEMSSEMDPTRCKLAGAKIFADGAIGSATAAINGEFLTTGGSGQLIYEPDRLKRMVRTADEAGWQVAVHSIGDRSTDHVLDAFSETMEPSRHRIEHAMILSDTQIEKIANLDCFVTMQPEFLARFGHAYQKQLGPERASRLKRYRSVLDAGIKLSFSSDRPIVPGDPLDGIEAAVTRPEGFDQAEALDRSTAHKLYSVESAKANGDGGTMGEIAEGRFADCMILRGREWLSLPSPP